MSQSSNEHGNDKNLMMDRTSRTWSAPKLRQILASRTAGKAFYAVTEDDTAPEGPS